jgi:hypothetical protein
MVNWLPNAQRLYCSHLELYCVCLCREKADTTWVNEICLNRRAWHASTVGWCFKPQLLTSAKRMNTENIIFCTTRVRTRGPESRHIETIASWGCGGVTGVAFINPTWWETCVVKSGRRLGSWFGWGTTGVWSILPVTGRRTLDNRTIQTGA